MTGTDLTGVAPSDFFIRGGYKSACKMILLGITMREVYG